MDPVESASACNVRSLICMDIMEHTFSQTKATDLIMFPTKKKNTRKWKRSVGEGLNVQRIGELSSPLHRVLIMSNVRKKIVKGNSVSSSGKKINGKIRKARSPMKLVKSSRMSPVAKDSSLSNQMDVSPQRCKRKVNFDLLEDSRVQKKGRG
ncbi:hypothetical protein Ddye_011163 [Dipteronia dyeriana]|uniref:Uncharacterized protein n=1 Tax=Dipteronia dyeriana TaxID=168575 RepID=A0AAD9XEN7_9ROSI|nr:hypothetical protein Ddye_011163 [Dipteronia dyeriana]